MPEEEYASHNKYNARGRVWTGNPSVLVTTHKNPGFLPTMKEKLLVPVLSAVLPAAELSQHVRQVFDNLRDCLQIRSYVSKKQRRLNITRVKRASLSSPFGIYVFFSVHAWTGTHGHGDFSDKIASTYCLVWVDNTAIIASCVGDWNI
jgi:hypothetical protein